MEIQREAMAARGTMSQEIKLGKGKEGPLKRMRIEQEGGTRRTVQ